MRPGSAHVRGTIARLIWGTGAMDSHDDPFGVFGEIVRNSYVRVGDAMNDRRATEHATVLLTTMDHRESCKASEYVRSRIHCGARNDVRTVATWERTDRRCVCPTCERHRGHGA